MILAIITIAWVIYCVSGGLFEARYHISRSGMQEGNSSNYGHAIGELKDNKSQEHAEYNIVRFFIAFSFALCVFGHYSMEHGAFWLVAAAMMFPFLHDGMYYEVAENLKPGTFPEGFKQNHDGRAIIDLSFTLRLIMFIASIGIIIYMYL